MEDICQQKLQTRCGPSLIKQSVLRSKKKKSEGVGKLKDTFNIKLEDAEFRIESAGFWSCFGSVVPHYFSFPPIWSEK